MVVENTPQKLEGVVRSEDPGEWKKPLNLPEGRTKNLAANLSSQKPSDLNKRSSALSDDGDHRNEGEGQRVNVKDMSQQFTRQIQEPWREKMKSEGEAAPVAIVLAENQPTELDPDVVRSSDNSEEVQLESGRTKNLLQHWKNAEVDFQTTKVSTTRYQGTKPAWIREIEEAKGIVCEVPENVEDRRRDSDLGEEHYHHTPHATPQDQPHARKMEFNEEDYFVRHGVATERVETEPKHAEVKERKSGSERQGHHEPQNKIETTENPDSVNTSMEYSKTEHACTEQRHHPIVEQQYPSEIGGSEFKTPIREPREASIKTSQRTLPHQEYHVPSCDDEVVLGVTDRD